jgi:tetratricopeptide (TPR) repeat protein
VAGELPRPEGLSDPGDLLRALETSAGAAQWVPLFSDDFGRTSLGEDWKIVGGQAHIENGWLRVSGKADCYAVVRRPFPDNIRLEFDARFPAGQEESSDLACFVAGDERSCDAVGYCLSFGSDNNTCSRIQRAGMDVRINTQLVAEPGRTYRIVAEAADGEYRLMIDGQMVLRYVDLVPLAGVGHDHLGLAAFKYGTEFANFRVLTHSGPAAVGIFTIADAYCRDGLFDRAIERFRQIAATDPEGRLALQAQTKVGLALFAAGRYGECEAQLRGLARKAGGTEMELLIELWRGLALGMMGKLDEALRTFAHVQSQSSNPEVIDEVAVACGRLSTQLRREERWLEAGRCAKFLFENLKTPLIETRHMFGNYVNRLHDAALYEEEFQAASRLVAAVVRRKHGASAMWDCNMRKFGAALSAGRVDEARSVLEELGQQARNSLNAASLELRVLGCRVQLALASGKPGKALEQLAGLTGTDREEQHIGDGRWGQTAADLRASALVLLGRMDEALEDLDAGRIRVDLLDLRLILGAELWKRGHEAAARACFAETTESGGLWRHEKLVENFKLTVCREMPVEAFQEYVGTELQPCVQPLGLFLTGLAMWANGEEQAALLTWSEARNSAPDTDPAWHWTSLYMSRVGK